MFEPFERVNQYIDGSKCDSPHYGVVIKHKFNYRPWPEHNGTRFIVRLNPLLALSHRSTRRTYESLAILRLASATR